MSISLKIKYVIVFFILSITSLYSQSTKEDSLLRSYTSSTTSYQKAKSSYDLSEYYVAFDIAKSTKYALLSINNYLQTNNLYGTSKSYIQLAHCYRLQGNSDSALVNYNKALLLAKKLNDSTLTCNVYLYSGIVNEQKNSFPKAASLYYQALRVAELLGNDTLKAKIYNGMGLLYYRQSNYSLAEQYYLKSKKIFESLAVNKSLAGVLGNLANVYSTINNYTKSREYSQQAYSLYTKTKDSVNMYGVLINISLLYMQERNYKEAESYLNRCKLFYDNHKELNGYFIYKSSLARVYENTSRLIKAEKLYLEIIKENSKTGHSEYAAELLYNLSIVYDRLKDYKKAYQYMFTHKQLEDSILSIQTNEMIERLKNEYELDKKEALIEEQKHSLQLNEQVIEQQQSLNQKQVIIIVLLIIAVVGGIIVLLITRRENRIKQQLLIEQATTKQQDEYIKAFIEGQENERTRIASDIHDDICQQLAMLKLGFSTVKTTTDDEQEKLQLHISEMDDVIGNTRKIAHEMMPGVLLELGLKKAIENLTSKIQATTNISIAFTFEGVVNTSDKKLEIHIYRIIQELLNNTIKHANASKIKIVCKALHETLYLNINDNGKGVDINNVVYGLGWKNISSRIKFLKGTLDIHSKINEGTHITIETPLNYGA